MRPSIALDLRRGAIREAASRFRTANPRVFGSVLHGIDQDGSDLDLLLNRRSTIAANFVSAFPRKYTALWPCRRPSKGLASIGWQAQNLQGSGLHRFWPTGVRV